jgi:hypothetical protein
MQLSLKSGVYYIDFSAEAMEDKIKINQIIPLNIVQNPPVISVPAPAVPKETAFRLSKSCQSSKSEQCQHKVNTRIYPLYPFLRMSVICADSLADLVISASACALAASVRACALTASAVACICTALL